MRKKLCGQYRLQGRRRTASFDCEEGVRVWQELRGSLR